MPPDDLRRLIAEDALRTPVPGLDSTVETQMKDRVVRGRLNQEPVLIQGGVQCELGRQVSSQVKNFVAAGKLPVRATRGCDVDTHSDQ
jgi:hypothetical protein